MHKPFLFIANWKMNMTTAHAAEFATDHYDAFVTFVQNKNKSIVLCPSFTSLYPLIHIFKTTPMHIGAQDCSAHHSGAFTGQVCAQDLNALGCTYCIVGHSERRTHNHENNQHIADKCSHLLDYDIVPIICIGESADEHKTNKTIDVLKSQLDPCLTIIKKKNGHQTHPAICIAYEPLWAIGAGTAAQPATLTPVLEWLAAYIPQKDPALEYHLLYGGSVSAQNAAQIAQIPHINGFLVGNASLEFTEFEKIVQLGM